MPELRIVGVDGEVRRAPTPGPGVVRRRTPGRAAPSLEEFVGRILRNLPRSTSTAARNEIHAALSGLIHHHGKATAYAVMDRLGMERYGFQRYGFDQP